MMQNSTILLITTWFPNPAEPIKCVFTQNIVNAQKKYTPYNFIVISPIPYMPKILGKIFKGRLKAFSEIGLIDKVDGITIYRPKYLKLPFQLSDKLDWYLYFRAVLSVIKKYQLKFDLIHTHGLYPDAYVGYKVSKYFNIPFVCHLHDRYLNILFDRYNLKLNTCLKTAKRIIAVSKFQANMFRHFLPINTINIVYNGTFIESFKIRDTNCLSKKLVFVGNLIEDKGIFSLLEAVSILKQQKININLDVFGRGEIEKCKNLASKYDISEIVNFRGIINNSELAEILCDYDLLALPSYYETFGIVLIEALAAGIPVVASNVASIPEIVTEDVGILIPPKNPNALADAISCALRKNWDRRIIRNQAEKFTLEQTAISIANIYKEILNN